MYASVRSPKRGSKAFRRMQSRCLNPEVKVQLSLCGHKMQGFMIKRCMTWKPSHELRSKVSDFLCLVALYCRAVPRRDGWRQEIRTLTQQVPNTAKIFVAPSGLHLRRSRTFPFYSLRAKVSDLRRSVEEQRLGVSVCR